MKIILIALAVLFVGAGCASTPPRECIERRTEIQVWGFNGWVWMGTNDLADAKEMMAPKNKFRRKDRCVKYRDL